MTTGNRAYFRCKSVILLTKVMEMIAIADDNDINENVNDGKN